MAEVLKLGKSPKPLDLELVEHGLRVEAPMAPGVFFTIGPWGDYSARYRRALERRAIRQAIEEKEGGEKTANEEEFITRFERLRDDGEFVAEALVMDIEGLLNGKGKAVEYTHERAVQVLSDPEWAHLRRWVVDQGLGLAARMQRGVEAEEKN